MVTATLSVDEVHRLLDEVVDPEIPVLTIADLGIVRDVISDDRGVLVTITPTYSGCPAMDLIKTQIRSVLEAAGAASVRVETVFAPAWSTSWMSEEAKRKLEESGIAAPGRPLCPRCRSQQTKVVSQFGSTACKALLVCASCGEPFDLFKEL